MTKTYLHKGLDRLLNMNGDLGMFAHFKGNKDLAMSAKPAISKQDAEQIALNKVYSNLNDLDKAMFPKLTTKSSLKIYKNILVYDVTVSPEDTQRVFPTYYFKIDAKNGNIVYEDVAG